MNSRPSSGGRGRPSGGRPGGPPRRMFQRKKFCRFCKDKDVRINYKDAKALRPYLTDRGKIVPRRISGNCAKHQREVCLAVKRARNIAIIPYTAISM